MLYTEFLRHLSMTAQIRHKGLAVGNITYSLHVSYVLSLFTQWDKYIFKSSTQSCRLSLANGIDARHKEELSIRRVLH